MVPVEPARNLMIENSPVYGLNIATFRAKSNGESLIGVGYRSPTDLYPVCIYGYADDLVAFS